MSLATASRNGVSSGMLEYLVVVLVGLIAFVGGQWWVIPIGALGMSIGPWFNQWKMLKEHPLAPFDSKVVQFFGAVYGNGLIACGGSYLIGILGGSFLG